MSNVSIDIKALDLTLCERIKMAWRMKKKRMNSKALEAELEAGWSWMEANDSPPTVPGRRARAEGRDLEEEADALLQGTGKESKAKLKEPKVCLVSFVEWSEEQVLEWLASLGLSMDYSAIFKGVRR